MLEDLISRTALLREYDRYQVVDAKRLIEEAPAVSVTEPKVLPADEIFGEGNVLWFERRIGNYCIPCEIEVCSSSLYAKVHFFDVSARLCALDAYGSEWRCWNQKPTIDQMKAVRWDE